MVAVIIRPGETPHCTGKGLYFIRIGSTKQVPTQQELLRLFQKRNILQFDETPVLRAEPEAIDRQKVDSYLERLGQSQLAQEASAAYREFTNLSILQDIEGVLRPTLAGLLAFGKHPQRFFPNYCIQCGAYKGDDTASNVVSEKSLFGTLDALIEDAMAFLRLVIPQDSRLVDSVQRSDKYAYPLEALREGIVNAVCHRDYTIAGSAIRIFVFKNFVQIRSPGGLPNTLTLQSMAYRQFARNQVIASFLSGFGYMERRGKGILKIQKLCRENDIDSRFELTPDGSEFVLSLSFRR